MGGTFRLFWCLMVHFSRQVADYGRQMVDGEVYKVKDEDMVGK